MRRVESHEPQLFLHYSLSAPWVSFARTGLDTTASTVSNQTGALRKRATLRSRTENHKTIKPNAASAMARTNANE